MKTSTPNETRAENLGKAIAQASPVASTEKPAHFTERVLTQHIELTGTKNESLSSQISDITLNLFHLYIQSVPELSSSLDLTKPFHSAASLSSFVKEKMTSAPVTELDVFTNGLTTLLRLAGEEPLQYIEFKSFDVLAELLGEK